MLPKYVTLDYLYRFCSCQFERLQNNYENWNVHKESSTLELLLQPQN